MFLAGTLPGIVYIFEQPIANRLAESSYWRSDAVNPFSMALL